MEHEKISGGRVLIVTAVEAERDAVRRGIGDDDRFHVIAAGVGPAAAAAGTAFALAKGGRADSRAGGQASGQADSHASSRAGERAGGQADSHASSRAGGQADSHAVSRAGEHASGQEDSHASSRAGGQAGEHASGQEDSHASSRAGEHASGQASGQADSHASSRAGGQAGGQEVALAATQAELSAFSGLEAAGLVAPILAAAAVDVGYRLVISAGIAGGFHGRAPIGSLVVAGEIIAADLGAETPDGFASVDELGFGSARIGVDARLAGALAAGIAAAGLPVSTGPVLTVTTATGSAAAAAEHERRVPGAAAEAMEGFGVATAAQQFGLPALELRAISNAVGPRDRDAWRIDDALRALERASQILKEVL